MNIISKAIGGAVGLVAQTATIASVGTTIGIAVGIGAVQKIAEKTVAHIAPDNTSFENSPSFKQAARRGLATTNYALHAGFRAFDQKINAWLKPNTLSGEVILSNSIAKDLKAHALDKTIIGKLRGPEHEQSVQALREVVRHGTEADVAYLFGELEKKGFGEDFDPIYFALSDRYPNWLGRAARYLDGIR
jgi:hypothetical protein